MKKRIRKIGLSLLFLVLTGGFIWLTIWCNTPYPAFPSYPPPYGRYSPAKIHLMTTDALIGTMLNQHGGSVWAYADYGGPHTLYHALTGMEDTYDWARKIFGREDIGEVVFRFYQNAERPLDLVEKYPMVQEDFNVQHKLDNIHGLLAHPKAQASMTDKQRAAVLNRVLETRNWYSGYSPFYPYYPYDKNDQAVLGEGGYESYWIDYVQHPDQSFQKFYCVPDETGTYVARSEEYPLGPLEREKGWRALSDRFYKMSKGYQYNSFEKRLLEEGLPSEGDWERREKTPGFYDRMDDPYLAVKRRYNRIGEYDEAQNKFVWDYDWQRDERKEFPDSP